MLRLSRTSRADRARFPFARSSPCRAPCAHASRGVALFPALRPSYQPCVTFHDLPDPEGPAAFVWSLRGGPPPPLTRALTICHAARAAAMRRLDAFGVTALPDWMHHAGALGDSPYWLALDSDDDGRIEQILCLRPGGFGPQVLPGFAAGASLWIGEGRAGEPAGRWRLAPEAMGPLAPGGVVGPASLWVSLTPYVVGRETHRGGRPRAGRSLEEQIRDDLAKRGLHAFGVEALSARLCAGGALAADAFDLHVDTMKPPPGAPAAFVRLAFAEPVAGPLALGYGAHYGLGLFVPQG